MGVKGFKLLDGSVSDRQNKRNGGTFHDLGLKIGVGDYVFTASFKRGIDFCYRCLCFCFKFVVCFIINYRKEAQVRKSHKLNFGRCILIIPSELV